MSGTKTYTAHSAAGVSHTFVTRTEKEGDRAVIDEVYTTDCYCLKDYPDAPPTVILDIGAHIGTFAVLAAQLWPGAEIHCFEPNKRSFELLRENTRTFPGIRCYNVAISYTQGHVLTDGDGATGGGFLTSAAWLQEETERVEAEGRRFPYAAFDSDVTTWTLERVFESVPNCDLAKFDCEGGEMDCFQHMELQTAERFGNLLGEYHTSGCYEGFVEVARRVFPRHRAEGRFTHSAVGGFWLWRGQ